MSYAKQKFFEAVNSLVGKQTLVTSAIPFALEKADTVDAKLAALVPELRDGGEIRDALRLKGIHFRGFASTSDGIHG
jgi:hypothetical protein